MSNTTAMFLSVLISVTAGAIVGPLIGLVSVPLAIAACMTIGIVCGSYLPNKLVKVTAPRK